MGHPVALPAAAGARRGVAAVPSRQRGDAAALRARGGCDHARQRAGLRRHDRGGGAGHDDRHVDRRHAHGRDGRLLAGAAGVVPVAADPRCRGGGLDRGMGRVPRAGARRHRRGPAERGGAGAGRAPARRHRPGQRRPGRGDDRAGDRRRAQPGTGRLDRRAHGISCFLPGARHPGGRIGRDLDRLGCDTARGLRRQRAMTAVPIATWCISAVAMAGVIVRPFRWPEAVWAVAGAGALVLLGLVTPEMALAGIAKGTDVYLFLAGMMLLSETARDAGLFDWLAMQAARQARGSAKRLFLLVYGVGVVVTIFLSNDATAVVLTPAVAAAVRAIRLRNPLPYLLICAFTANAASFVLPISNPANLVMYASHMPSLGRWLQQYGPAAAVSVIATYACLRWVERGSFDDEVPKEVPDARLSRSGRIAAAGIALAA